MAERFEHNEQEQQYALYDGDDIVSTISYRHQGNIVTFTSTFTPPQFRGQGYAATIVERAVDDAAKDPAVRIVPECSYVSAWFSRHPERAGLLHR